MNLNALFDRYFFGVGLLLSIALLAASSVNVSRAQLGDQTTGYDPLSSAEISALTDASFESPEIMSGVRSAGSLETLLIERHQEEKQAVSRGNWSRRADVYLYDYSNDTLIIGLIDLESGDVETVERVQNVQLPLTETELARATDIVNNNSTVRDLITEQYTLITGESLTALDVINIKAFTFRGDSMPDVVNSAAADCGIQRCAQLLIYTTENIALDIMPIVSLSSGSVVQVISLDGETVE